MKNILKVCIGIFIIACYSCGNKTSKNDYEKVLGGKHELRKFNVKTTTAQNASAWCFLVMGGYANSTTRSSVVRFYFLNHRGEYQLLELPLNDVNIKIDSTIKNPYVKFFWHEMGVRDESEWRMMFKYNLTGAVIYCKESDFRPEININDLK